MCKRSKLVPLAVCLLQLCAAGAFCAIQAGDVETTRDGDLTYFRMQLAFPPDYVPMTGAFINIGNSAPPRFPMMYTTASPDGECYMATEQSNRWGPLEPTNFFYGRTTSTDQMSLTLRYPVAAGEWKEEKVEVKLSGAAPLTSRSVMRIGRDASETLSPIQQYANARASYLVLKGQHVPNDGGFYNFAAVHTLQNAHISVPEWLHLTDQPWDADSPRDRLYETATGARAIQETLQVDRMLGSSQTTQPRTMDISSVDGVQTKSHPFKEMLKGKTPQYSDVARVVPADNYMLQFKSAAKLMELGQLAQTWGSAVLQSPEVGSPDDGLRLRYQQQLCLPDEAFQQLTPDLLKEVVVTGSDIYFREGTDLSVIFSTPAADSVKAALSPHWTAPAGATAADKGTTTIEGADVDFIRNADRTVSAYRTTADGLVIYSNSPAALQRILQVKAKPEQSLAEELDFQYMRTVWPEDAANEDGFVYLSDAFVRQLVGPASKIKEKRRLEAYNSMRLVMNAAMLHGYDTGRVGTPSIDELVQKNYLTRGELALLDGEVSWEPKTATASSSLYGNTRFLTPLCELPISKISESERSEYTRFRERYQQYWRRYFDPIGVRIKLDSTIRVEAYILPLIDESAYQELKALSGDKPAKFDLSSVSTGTVVRWQLRLDPEARQVRDIRQMAGGMMGRDSAVMEWIGEWVTVWLEDSEVSAELFASTVAPALGEEVEETTPTIGGLSFFKIPVAAGVHVKNKLSLAAFLVGLQGLASSAAPDLVQFVPQPAYKGVTMVKIMPKPGGQLEHGFVNPEDAQTTTGDIGLYYATIGDGWYISTQENVIRGIIDAAETASMYKPRVIEYNGLLLVSPANVVKARPVVEKASHLLMRNVERDMLHQAWLLYRCGLAASGDELSSASQTWLGGPLKSLSGSTITIDEATNQPVSSKYGPLYDMNDAAAVEGNNPIMQLFDMFAHIRAWLRFTEDGLATTLELEQTTAR